MRDYGQHLWQQAGEGLLGKFHAAFEADGEQQHDADELVNRRRKSQLGTQQAGHGSEQEEENDGIDHIVTL